MRKKKKKLSHLEKFRLKLDKREAEENILKPEDTKEEIKLVRNILLEGEM